MLPEATKRLCYRSRNQNIEYCFNELGYQYLLADKPNLESRKVAERIGMREVEEKGLNGNSLLFFRVERLW